MDFSKKCSDLDPGRSAQEQAAAAWRPAWIVSSRYTSRHAIHLRTNLWSWKVPVPTTFIVSYVERAAACAPSSAVS